MKKMRKKTGFSNESHRYFHEVFCCHIVHTFIYHSKITVSLNVFILCFNLNNFLTRKTE